MHFKTTEGSSFRTTILGGGRRTVVRERRLKKKGMLFGILLILLFNKTLSYCATIGGAKLLRFKECLQQRGNETRSW